ncbi:MAG: hypothetical protein ACTSR7_12205 [Promethearchaeota archaeon]
MAINLASVEEEVRNFMKNGKYLKPAKLLNTIFRSIERAEIPSFGDLMANLAQEFPDLFIQKIYIAFQFQLRKNFPQEILYELDKYIIENYCLLEGETITDFFYGNLRDKYTLISGRIFLTNLRLIVIGYPTPVSKSSSPVTKSFSALRKELIHIAIGRAIKRALYKDLKDLELITYGSYYPIYNAYKIKRDKSAVRYNVDVEYERKGKKQVENLKLKVSPGKMKEELARKEEILSNIENLLIQYQ